MVRVNVLIPVSSGAGSVGLPNQSWTDEGQRPLLHPEQSVSLQHRRLLLGRPAGAEAGGQELRLRQGDPAQVDVPPGRLSF